MSVCEELDGVVQIDNKNNQVCERMYKRRKTCGFSTFLCVTLPTHVTVRDVCVTQRTNSAIMQHLMHKSIPIVSRIVPKQSETSAHSIQGVAESAYVV